MSADSPTFDVSFSNVPIVNLRWEFKDLYACVHTVGFLRDEEGRVRSLRTRYFLWLGMPDAGATVMVARAVLGLEAYLKFAAGTEGVMRGVSTPKLTKACANPFSLSRKTAHAHFNLLPALVSEELAMKNADARLWKATSAFYREIRNPIFHGREFNDIKHDTLGGLFDLLADVYDWMDSWHDPDVAMPGLAESCKVRDTGEQTDSA